MYTCACVCVCVCVCVCAAVYDATTRWAPCHSARFPINSARLAKEARLPVGYVAPCIVGNISRLNHRAALAL